MQLIIKKSRKSASSVFLEFFNSFLFPASFFSAFTKGKFSLVVPATCWNAAAMVLCSVSLSVFDFFTPQEQWPLSVLESSSFVFLNSFDTHSECPSPSNSWRQLPSATRIPQSVLQNQCTPLNSQLAEGLQKLCKYPEVLLLPVYKSHIKKLLLLYPIHSRSTRSIIYCRYCVAYR